MSLCIIKVARAREMVSRLASLKTIELSSSAFIGGVAGRLGRLGMIQMESFLIYILNKERGSWVSSWNS